MSEEHIDLFFNCGVDIGNRLIMINQDLDSSTSSNIIRGLYYLSNIDSKIPIKLVVSSYGGEEGEMFAIHDVMKEIKTPVHTHGIGKVMSAAVLLLASGEKGHRTCGPNTCFMVHKTQYPIEDGDEKTIKSELQYLKILNNNWLNLMEKYSNIKKRTWKNLISKSADHNFDAKKALQYGIIDAIKD